MRCAVRDAKRLDWRSDTFIAISSFVLTRERTSLAEH